MEQRYEIEAVKARLANLLHATFWHSLKRLRGEIEQLKLLLADRAEQAALIDTVREAAPTEAKIAPTST